MRSVVPFVENGEFHKVWDKVCAKVDRTKWFWTCPPCPASARKSRCVTNEFWLAGEGVGALIGITRQLIALELGPDCRAYGYSPLTFGLRERPLDLRFWWGLNSSSQPSRTLTPFRLAASFEGRSRECAPRPPKSGKPLQQWPLV